MLLEFHESYRKVNWDSLIQQAEHSLTIVVYYWDKWVKEHEKSLQQFLKKPSAKIQFFFSDNLAEVQKLFPNNTREQLEEKIRLTYQPLQKLAPDQVSVTFLPQLLNYSMQAIDDKILVLSFFEMFRQEQVDSPALVLDLEKSQNLKKFYTKEIKGLRDNSMGQPIQTEKKRQCCKSAL